MTIQTDNSETDERIKNRFVPKSGWRPNPPNRTLETFQRSVKQDLLKFKISHKGHRNLTKEERLGFDALKQKKKHCHTES